MTTSTQPPPTLVQSMMSSPGTDIDTLEDQLQLLRLRETTTTTMSITAQTRTLRARAENTVTGHTDCDGVGTCM